MKQIQIFLILICVSQSLFAQKHHSAKHRFSDANEWADIFEDPSRDKWQRPTETLKELDIRPESLVADIGSATGYFPTRLAQVATKGRVWGVDVEPNLVKYLNHRARKEKLNNLFSVLGTYDDPLIPEPVDLITCVNTYHHIHHRVAYLKNLKKYLRPSAKVAIIDFKKEKLPVGPSSSHKLSPKKVLEEFSEAGYKLTKRSKILPYQYILIFKI